MKRIAFIPFLALAIACGNNAESTGEVADLQKEKDSLVTLKETVNNRIAELNEQLAKLDTTKKLREVTAFPLETTTFKHYIEMYGNVESDQTVDLIPEMPAKVVSIPVKEGQKVGKGQLLVQLDDAVLQRNLQQVKAQYELANTTFQKQSKLWKDSIGSEIQFLQSKTQKESLEEQVKQLEAQIAKTRITAPFSGEVDEVFAKVGEMASNMSPAVRLVSASELHIEVELSESYIGRVKTGAEVLIEVPSTKQEIQAKVSNVGSYISPGDRTFKVNILLPDNSNLNPNALAIVKILDYSKDSTYVIPASILQQDPTGHDYVYTVSKDGERNKVNKTLITTGLSYNNKVHVKEGLSGGVNVVDKGSRSIRDGEFVKIVTTGKN